jgi:integrase
MRVEKTKYPGIYRRGEKYVATISYRDELGRSHVKWVTCSTLNAARRARRQTEDKLDEGIRPSDARMPLSDYLTETWLPHVRRTRRELTANTYSGIVRRYIAPALGHVALRDLDRAMISRLYEMQPSTSIAHACHGALSAALGYAVSDLGILGVNPCRTVKAPQVEREETRHLDIDEAKRMLQVANGWRLEPAIILGLVGGMRIAEVCALSWRDVDLGTGTVTVRRSWWGKTKSGKVRTFTLPESQVARLRRLKREQAETLLRRGVRQTEDTFVITKRDGGQMSPSTLTFAFNNFTAKHGFDVSFHGLRHSATILLLTSGVDVKTAASRLGHNPALMLRTYAHFVPSADRQAAERIENVLG